MKNMDKLKTLVIGRNYEVGETIESYTVRLKNSTLYAEINKEDARIDYFMACSSVGLTPIDMDEIVGFHNFCELITM